MAGCRPPAISLALALGATGLAYYSTGRALGVSLYSTVEGVIVLVLALASVSLLPFAVAFTARSPILGAVTAYASLSIVGGEYDTVRDTAIATSIILMILALRWRGRDSSLEYLLAGERFYATPVLIALSLGLALGPITGLDYYSSPQYWTMLVLGSLVASRVSNTLHKAVGSGFSAALAPLGTLVLVWATTFLPLPPPACSGTRIGRILAVDGEASPHRLLYKSSRKNYGLVCVEEGPATVDASPGRVIWVYSRDPRRIVSAITVSEASRSNRRMLLLDFDRPGPTSLARIDQELEGNTGIIGLGSLHAEDKKLALSLAAERIKEDLVVGLAWCNPDWETLYKVVSGLVKPGLTIVVGACSIPAGSLTPVKGTRGSQVVVGDTGDPSELSMAASRLLGEELGARVARDLAGYSGYVLVSPYCGSIVALARLEGND